MRHISFKQGDWQLPWDNIFDRYHSPGRRPEERRAILALYGNTLDADIMICGRIAGTWYCSASITGNWFVYEVVTR